MLAVAAGLLAPAARAQTVPAPPPGSAKKPPPTFGADTARHVVVVGSAEPTKVTRRLGLRIGTAVVVFTLTTLLLYNVRSR